MTSATMGADERLGDATLLGVEEQIPDVHVYDRNRDGELNGLAITKWLSIVDERRLHIEERLLHRRRRSTQPT